MSIVVFQVIAFIVVCGLCVLIGYMQRKGLWLLLPIIFISLFMILLMYNNNVLFYDEIIECIENGGNINWCVDKHYAVTRTENTPFLKYIGYK